MNVSDKKQVDATLYFSSQGAVTHRKGKIYTSWRKVQREMILHLLMQEHSCLMQTL